MRLETMSLKMLRLKMLRLKMCLKTLPRLPKTPTPASARRTSRPT
jgi:hypothetical protein